jgi:hypothetical protein
MADDDTLETLNLLLKNYITLPEEARQAGLEMARQIQNSARQSYFIIREIVQQLENITKDAN